MGTMNRPPRRRRRNPERRPRRLSIRLSDEELWALESAADDAELSVGAWVADVAVAVACKSGRGAADAVIGSALREALTELNQCRTQLAKAGGLLNQAVAGLHSYNLEEDRLRAAAAYVRRRVEALDQRLDELWARLP